ncbi:MAG: hypothetical protein OQK04_13110 [Kangiellaceae bacterium]|nr:hypothetical protein [Kangiellaceae bacterium]MCW8999640.1 hypothetical protein [Kangiellaceae bacterium]
MVKLAIIIFCIAATTTTLAADPTRPVLGGQALPVASKKSPSKQSLTAIIKRDNQYFAVLDGDIYQQGDRYLGGRIRKITRTSVLLSLPNGNKKLTLIPKIKSQ